MARRRVVVGMVALAVAAFAGGAYAATQSSTNSRQAFLDDVAKRLNVTPAQLESAIKGAFLDRLNAAVKAGTLTQAQATQIEQRLQQTGTIPFFGPRALGGGLGRFFFAPRGPTLRMRLGKGGALAAAAGYLGLTRAQLMKDLASGQTFAQIAKAQGKSLQGLESAVLAAFRSRLDSAVAAGRITKAQEQQLLNGLSARIDRSLTGDFRAFPTEPVRRRERCSLPRSLRHRGHRASNPRRQRSSLLRRRLPRARRRPREPASRPGGPLLTALSPSFSRILIAPCSTG
jgi:hypothetical protein